MPCAEDCCKASQSIKSLGPLGLSFQKGLEHFLALATSFTWSQVQHGAEGQLAVFKFALEASQTTKIHKEDDGRWKDHLRTNPILQVSTIEKTSCYEEFPTKSVSFSIEMSTPSLPPGSPLEPRAASRVGRGLGVSFWPTMLRGKVSTNQRKPPFDESMIEIPMLTIESVYHQPTSHIFSNHSMSQNPWYPAYHPKDSWYMILKWMCIPHVGDNRL